MCRGTIVNAGTACSHRLRGRVRPCYNVIEIHDGNRVRALLKEPYAYAEVVADYRALNRRFCLWRPERAEIAAGNGCVTEPAPDFEYDELEPAEELGS